MYEDENNETEGFLDIPSFESPSDLKELEARLSGLLQLCTKLTNYVFNQAKLVALLDAKLELLNLEVQSLRAQLASRQQNP